MSPVPEKIDVLWFLPTHGDSRYLGTSIGGRNVDLNYLKQVAQAADTLGYFGVLIPTGRSCEDSWIVASALAPLTEKLRYLVAVRPGLLSPTLAARMTATLDRISNGRLLINVVTGGDPIENKGDGIHYSHEERYEVTEEFINIYKAVLRGEDVTTKSKHFDIEDAKLLFKPVQDPHPPLYFGGSSGVGQQVAARTIDKYLTWGEPPEDVEKKVAEVRALAQAEGREVTFGIRLHVIVRETAKEAWTAADELIKYVDEDTIAAAQKVFERMDSVGQSRMSKLHGRQQGQAGNQPEPVGGRRPGARRCGDRTRGRSRSGQGADRRVPSDRHRYLHLLRLSASGRGLPVRRAGAAQSSPQPPGQVPQGERQYRPVRRNHCRGSPPFAQGFAVLSGRRADWRIYPRWNE